MLFKNKHTKQGKLKKQTKKTFIVHSDGNNINADGEQFMLLKVHWI